MPSNDLMKVQLDILNNNVCKHTYQDSFVIIDKQICAGVLEGGHDSRIRILFHFCFLLI